MKKIIAILISVMLMCAVFVTLALSASNNGAENTSVTISIPGISSVRATYTESKLNARGETIKYYSDADGNEYVLNADGEIRGATLRTNRSTSVSSNENADFTEAEIREIAERFVALLTDNDTSFEETYYGATGSGNTILYTFVFNQFIEGIKTENSVYVCYNAAGKILDFSCINDIDYSKLNTVALASVSDALLEDFVTANMHVMFPEGFDAADITDTYIVEKDGKYSVCVLVNYTANVRDNSGAVIEQTDTTGLYYEIK